VRAGVVIIVRFGFALPHVSRRACVLCLDKGSAMRSFGVVFACLVVTAACDGSPELGRVPEADGGEIVRVDADTPEPVIDAGTAAHVDPMRGPPPLASSDASVPAWMMRPSQPMPPLSDIGDSKPQGGLDAGRHAPEPVIDAGTDAGEAIHDPTTPAADGGGLVSDAGSSALDSGTVPTIDAGSPAFDAGTTPPVVDSGTPAHDAGSPVVDSGTPVHDAGSDAATPNDSGVDAAAPSCVGPPGLYQDTQCLVLSDGIEAYAPQYPLWSDGAKKERFIALPAGTHIDTTNPDRWTFPVGTRFYKTFASGDLKVETRVMQKVSSATGFDSWTLVSYAWSADQRSVSVADSNGVPSALGTNFDIPSTAQCRSCHNMTGADAPIGFNALQLNHNNTGVTLTDLLNRQLLMNGSVGATPNITLTNTLIPGDATTKAALGYLHGNCGHCHGGPTPRAGQRLWSVVGMTDVSDAPIMTSAVCQCLESWTGRTNASGDPYELRVSPSHFVVSGIIGRMSARTAGEQMPPLGTKVVDATGLAAIKAWITSLDGTSCDASPPVCNP
jgi:hypothetical protein